MIAFVICYIVLLDHQQWIEKFLQLLYALAQAILGK